jgi:RND family efflux transporter MFP subunit
MTRHFRATPALIVLVIAASVITGCHDRGAQKAPPADTGKAEREVLYYRNPMDPSVTSPTPAKDSMNMDYIPVYADEEQPRAERKILYYRNPMDPSVTSPTPAKDSMGMDYLPVYADGQEESGFVEGFASVTIGSQGLRLAGVQTAVAKRGTLSRATRTVGLVTPDETRIHHVHTKTSGWVEKLYVNFTGQQVRKGQPILALYSPELLATQEEFLRARAAAAEFSHSSLPEVRSGGEDLLRAARRRLELFDAPASLIATLEKTGKPQRTVSLFAPVSGYVTAKEVFEGQEIEPGMELFTITDLSRAWVEAEFYENEAHLLRIGQKARVSLPFDPHVLREGRVTYIYPTLDPASRTLKVRLEFANPDLALKPGMYADIQADLDSHEGIVVPDSSLIDTGDRQIVFVQRQDGLFEPRQVHIMTRSGGEVLVLQGVEEGETVVIRANFLIDSESRLRAAILAMQGAAARADEGARP